MTTTRLTRSLAIGAIVGQALFIGGWLVAGALEGHGYSPGRHDISDLGAVTAHHAGVILVTDAVSGLLTIAFAVGALVPALTVPGRRSPLGAWLVAFSLPALDNLGDTFFRVDCRAADPGCSASHAYGSWHGTMHVVVFGVAALATVIAPFALSRRMRIVDGWKDLAQPAFWFGIAFVVGFVVTGAATDTSIQGWTQRTLILLTCSGIVVLAGRVLQRTRYSPPCDTAPTASSPVTRGASPVPTSSSS